MWFILDDEPNDKKSNELKSGIQQKKLTISKDPGWSPLKCSVVESSHGKYFIFVKKKKM